MHISQVAVQLYTLRDFCKSSPDLAQTAKRVREIGYQAVQVSGVGPIEPSEIRAILDGEGLTICATHESPDEIRKSPEKSIERLQALGCAQTAYPYPAGVDFSDEASVASLIADLSAAADVMRGAGITLSYHNHANEFAKLGNETLMDRIFREAPGLFFELDTYWVQAGGANPVDWVRKVAGRISCVHLKDFAVTTDGKAFFAEVGHGNLAIPEILREAEKAGCRWFIVEQDTCPRDPFESIAMSFDYLKTLV